MASTPSMDMLLLILPLAFAAAFLIAALHDWWLQKRLETEGREIKGEIIERKNDSGVGVAGARRREATGPPGPFSGDPRRVGDPARCLDRAALKIFRFGSHKTCYNMPGLIIVPPYPGALLLAMFTRRSRTHAEARCLNYFDC